MLFQMALAARNVLNEKGLFFPRPFFPEGERSGR